MEIDRYSSQKVIKRYATEGKSEGAVPNEGR